MIQFEYVMIVYSYPALYFMYGNGMYAIPAMYGDF